MIIRGLLRLLGGRGGRATWRNPLVVRPSNGED